MNLDENDFFHNLCQTPRRLEKYFEIPHHVMAQWKLKKVRWLWLTLFILDQSSRLLNIMEATEQHRYNFFCWSLLISGTYPFGAKNHLLWSISCFNSLLIDSVSLGKSIQNPSGYQTMITVFASSIIRDTWGHLEMTSERTFNPTH